MNCFPNVDLLSYVVNPESFPTITVNTNPQNQYDTSSLTICLSYSTNTIITFKRKCVHNYNLES